MSSWITFTIVFGCISGGILLGIFLRRILDVRHLNDDTKDVVRLGTGLIGTIAALVLGLLIASAKTSFDTKNSQINLMIANTILLDALLAQYGPEAVEERRLMRQAMASGVMRIWREDGADHSQAKPFEASRETEEFHQKLLDLAPKNDAQRTLKDRAVQAGLELARTRFLLFAEAEKSIPLPFLIVLVLWLTIIFTSFSLFAQPSSVVVSFLFIFALSSAGAIYLILDLSQPFAGLMQIPSEPLRNALAPLGR